MRRLRQGILDVEQLEHPPEDPLWREAAPVPDLWQALHCQLQPLLPQDDTQEGGYSSNSKYVTLAEAALH